MDCLFAGQASALPCHDRPEPLSKGKPYADLNAHATPDTEFTRKDYPMTDSPASFSRPGFLAKSGLALIKRLSGASPSRLNLALQGGGAHGAFTWGVLDALLEDTRIEFEGLSGGSAGAMNSVVLADGWMKGGRDGARPAQFLPQHRPRHAGLDPLVRLGQVDRAHRERARARGRLRVHGRVTRVAGARRWRPARLEAATSVRNGCSTSLYSLMVWDAFAPL